MYAEGKKVNLFNRNIMVLLKAQQKSLNALAKFLQYDITSVEKQLNSESTFDFDDLLRICTFLNQLPADFFYERLPENKAEIANDLKGDFRLVGLRIMETHKQVVKYYLGKVVYN